MNELSIGALLGVAVGLAVDLFKKHYELKLATRRDVQTLVGELSAGIARMTHLILWTTYRATPATVAAEVADHDRETHELIGLLVSAQAKLSITSANEFHRITPWISNVIKLSELNDEALEDLKRTKPGAADRLSNVNSRALSFLKEFQASMTARTERGAA
jgi:hypothetical protein